MRKLIWKYKYAKHLNKLLRLGFWYCWKNANSVLYDLRDDWCYEISEDGELPCEVEASIDILNKIIMEQRPVSWRTGKYAVDLTCIDSELAK